MSDTPRTTVEIKLIFETYGDNDGSDFHMLAEFARTLERENDKLRKDKERLDWLEGTHLRPEFWLTLGGEHDIRSAIDKSMKRLTNDTL